MPCHWNRFWFALMWTFFTAVIVTVIVVFGSACHLGGVEYDYDWIEGGPYYFEELVVNGVGQAITAVTDGVDTSGFEMGDEIAKIVRRGVAAFSGTTAIGGIVSGVWCYCASDEKLKAGYEYNLKQAAACLAYSVIFLSVFIAAYAGSQVCTDRTKAASMGHAMMIGFGFYAAAWFVLGIAEWYVWDTTNKSLFFGRHFCEGCGRYVELERGENRCDVCRSTNSPSEPSGVGYPVNNCSGNSQIMYGPPAYDNPAIPSCPPFEPSYPMSGPGYDNDQYDDNRSVSTVPPSAPLFVELRDEETQYSQKEGWIIDKKNTVYSQVEGGAPGSNRSRSPAPPNASPIPHNDGFFGPFRRRLVRNTIDRRFKRAGLLKDANL